MSYRSVAVLLLLLLFNSVNAQVKYPKKNGKYESWNNGSRVVGTVSNYLATGKFTYYSQDGYDYKQRIVWRVTAIRNYKKGILEGKYYEFELDGDTAVVGAYKNDVKSGEWRMYTDTKLTGRIVYDENGNGTGWRTYKREDGAMRKESYGADGRNYQWNYTPNGKYSSRGELLGVQKDGTWFYYDSTETAKDSVLLLTVQYKLAAMHGEETRYKNGSISTVSQYANGQLNGLRKQYATNGQVICEEEYKTGKLNGKQKKYSLSGKQFTEWNYVNGNPDAACVVYDTLSGTLLEEHQFEKGTLINMKRFSAQHKLIAEQLLLERDSLVYSYKEYHDNGAMKSTGRLIGTRRTGPFESWHKNGKKNTTAFFRNDRHYGNVSVYTVQGIKVLYTKCKNGRDTVPEDVWSDAGGKLVFGTLAYEKQRAKYIPTDLVPHYEDLYVLGDAIINYISPIGPWSNWTFEIDLGGHFIGTDQHTVPAFPGGPEAQANFIQSNIQYPEYEKTEHITGKNVVTFTVRADGSITAIDLARSVSPGMDAEALRIVRMMPDWKPATINGVAREGRCWLEFDWRIVERKER